jgi:hypothetical protein
MEWILTEFHHPNWVIFFRGIISMINRKDIIIVRTYIFFQIEYISDLGIMISMMKHFVYFVQCVQPWWKNGVEQEGIDLWRLGGWFFWDGRGSKGNVELHVMIMMCSQAHDLPKIVRARNLLTTYGGFRSHGGYS